MKNSPEETNENEKKNKEKKSLADFVHSRAFAVIAFALMFCAGVAVTAFMLIPPKLRISEICPTNDGTHPQAQVTDAAGKLCDWIELYNPTNKAIDLKDFSIRKDGGEKYPLGSFKVLPGEYVIVYCSANGFTDDSVPHVDFSIPKGLDSEIELCYGYSVCEKLTLCEIDKGRSFSKDENGKLYISEPTPAAENDPYRYAATPRFDHKSGFYQEEFELGITAYGDQPIYYTTDGSDPRTSDTRVLYDGKIRVADMKGAPNRLSAYDTAKIQLDYKPDKIALPADEDVDKGTVIRACAVDEQGKYGQVTSAAFFVGLSTESHSGMPVLSVITDPEGLYDPETGIYCLGNVFEEYAADHPDHPYNGSVPANYNQKGRDWEKQCHIDFFESDGTLKLSQDAGIRIQGGWSRADYQKSFRFYARGSYGTDSFAYPFWINQTQYPNISYEELDRFVMRNGGNDANFSKFKDIMLQELVQERDVSIQRGRPCVMYLDGEYWGFYTLQEDYTPDYFEAYYGVDPDQVITYKSGAIDEGDESDEELFNEMSSFIAENDMSDPENYKKACELLDIKNFADYVAIEMYIYNTDWPQNNYACWRVRTPSAGNEYSDGRWRFYVFDTESGANHYNTKSDDKDILTYVYGKNKTILGKMIISLLDNDEFRALVVTDLCDMAELCFDYDRVTEFTERYRSAYSSEMEAFYKRFQTNNRSVGGTMEPMLERMDNFFRDREERLRPVMEERWELSERREVTIDLSILDSADIYINGSCAGAFFDGFYYDGCTLDVRIVPREGFLFTGWTDGSDRGTEFTLKVNGSDIDIMAEVEVPIV
ncbi:MAG: CotH kinase family protein [Ruminococcus sp.]|nr:CotH kinase family protein [Ruminococcus sp.]